PSRAVRRCAPGSTRSGARSCCRSCGCWRWSATSRSGAPASAASARPRASTLVNYVGLDDALIDYVCEIAGSLKIGKCMPGTGIPVVEESRLFSDQPDCAIIFSWHIADELAPKLRAKGYRGKLVTPLPVPREV